MKVVSYNLRKHRAMNELAALDERYSPDLMCLQECDTTDLPQRLGHLELAMSTSGNRLGLAVYYRPDRYEFRVVRSFALKKSLHDHLLRPAHERLIGVRLLDLEAAARARRRLVPRGAPHRPELPASPPDQVGARAAAVPRARSADADGRRLQLPRLQGQPRREGARGRVRADPQRQPARTRGTSSSAGTSTSRPPSGFDIDRVETLPRGSSDHLPILVDARYADVPAEPADVVI